MPELVTNKTLSITSEEYSQVKGRLRYDLSTHTYDVSIGSVRGIGSSALHNCSDFQGEGGKKFQTYVVELNASYQRVMWAMLADVAPYTDRKLMF